MIAWLAYLIVCVVWGSTYFAIAFGLESFTTYGLVASRFGIAAVIAFVIGRVMKDPWPTPRETLHLIFVGFLLLGCSNALVTWSELHIDTSIAAIVISLTPIWFALFSIKREPLSFSGRFGLALGFVGVAILLWPQEGANFDTGALTALLAASVIWAYATLHGKRHIRGGGLFTNVSLEMATAAVVGVCATMILPGGFTHTEITQNALVAMLYLAIFGSTIAFSAFVYLSKTWPAAKLSTYAYINPLVAVLLGTLVLNEPIGVRELLAFVVVICAVWLVQMKK